MCVCVCVYVRVCECFCPNAFRVFAIHLWLQQLLLESFQLQVKYMDWWEEQTISAERRWAYEEKMGRAVLDPEEQMIAFDWDWENFYCSDEEPLRKNEMVVPWLFEEAVSTVGSIPLDTALSYHS